MERKYYLRGLGLGIVVTAVIMGIVSSRSRTMTDSEIVARAKELGMVENTVLSEMNEDEVDNPSEIDEIRENDTENNEIEDSSQVTGSGENGLSDSEAEQKDAGVLPAVSGEKQKSPTEAAGDLETAADPEIDPAGDKEEGVQEEDANDIITSAAVKTITVNSGDGSHTVAKKLADAGVVISADDFDTFLCQYGYDKKLRTGTFSIPADASDEQIARIVTGME